MNHQLKSRRLQQNVIIVSIGFREAKDSRIKRGNPVHPFGKKHGACS
jgi:hypothetical protein